MSNSSGRSSNNQMAIQPHPLINHPQVILITNLVPSAAAIFVLFCFVFYHSKMSKGLNINHFPYLSKIILIKNCVVLCPFIV
jgi:hypothetical protein